MILSVEWSEWGLLLFWALGVKATVLIAVTTTIIRLLRPDAAWETLLWRVTLLWIPLLAPLELWLPSWQVVPVGFDASGVVNASSPMASTVPPATIDAAPLAWPLWLSSLAILTYLAGVAASLTGLLLGLIRLRSYRAQGSPMREGPSRRHLFRLCRRMGITRAPRALWSRHIASPVSWGLHRATILLPQSWSSASDSRLEHALAHELAHVRRGDWIWHLFSAATAALCWWNPVVRWAVRRHAEQVEIGCDQIAVAHCSSAASYARSLLLAATSSGPTPALSMAGKTELARRVESLIESLAQPQSTGPRMNATTKLCTHVAAALLILPLAACSLTQAADSLPPAPSAAASPTPSPDEAPPIGPTAPARAAVPAPTFTPRPSQATRSVLPGPATAPTPASAPVVAHRARSDAALARAEAMRAEAQGRLARQHSLLEAERAQLATENARMLAVEAAEMAEMRAALAQVSDRQRVMSDEMARELSLLQEELERTRQELAVAHEELERLKHE